MRRQLGELGLLEQLAQVAALIDELGFFNRHGQKVWGEPRGLACGFHWPQYAIHRGTLQALLHDDARARLGRDRIVTGHSLTRFEQDAAGVVAHFAGPASGAVPRAERGDVLIGADGLHSVVRRHHYAEQPLRFGGQLMWRSAFEGPAFLGGRSMVIAGHRNQKFVAYPMTPPRDGKVVINWMAELGQSGDAPPREEWNRRVDKGVFADRFADWRFDWLDIPAIIDRAEVILELPKVDRDPVDRWSFGRVTLLGDAAHPMHPVGSQAGSQAILDARVLAWHLARGTRQAPDALRTRGTRGRLSQAVGTGGAGCERPRFLCRATGAAAAAGMTRFPASPLHGPGRDGRRQTRKGIVMRNAPSLCRRTLAMAAASLAFGGAARAQPVWPDRPVRLITPTAPGTSPDVAARFYASGSAPAGACR